MAPAMFDWGSNASSTWNGLTKPCVLFDFVFFFLITLEYFYIFGVFPMGTAYGYSIGCVFSFLYECQVLGKNVKLFYNTI